MKIKTCDNCGCPLPISEPPSVEDALRDAAIALSDPASGDIHMALIYNDGHMARFVTFNVPQAAKEIELSEFVKRYTVPATASMLSK